ncbi:MAG: tyrosine-type recombinase/integrase, partial [Rhodospirillaceae bacterium]
MAKLTKRVVDSAVPDPNGKQLIIWDSEVKGFALRVTPAGAKSYILNYRTAEGRERRFTIGKHGSPWTCEDARIKAADLLRAVSEGRDPMEEKADAKAAVTIKELADLYLAEGPAEKPNKKASSWKADESNIRRHIVPLLGSKLAKAITQADVARFQRDIAAGKTATDQKTGLRGRAIVEGGKGTAARSLAVFGAMLQFGVGRALLPANPAKGVKLYQGEKKERFLSESEVARLAETLAAMEAEGVVNSITAAAVRLLLLTGCRKNEVLGLRWDWVDFERSCLRLPDSKTGAKVVPLAAAALEVLAGLPRTSEWALPASKGDGHLIGLPKAWEKLRDRAGLPGLRLHDLRHSFASFAVADGTTLYMVGKVLGHKQTRTTEGYAHLASDPLNQVANRTANRISAAMKGKATPRNCRITQGVLRAP